MTDRDTFAAAALTGLIAEGDDGSFSEESYVRAAYRWADAMLRVRSGAPEDCETVRYRLTDEELVAVEWAISAASNVMHPAEDTLRKLLERVK